LNSEELCFRIPYSRGKLFGTLCFLLVLNAFAWYVFLTTLRDWSTGNTSGSQVISATLFIIAGVVFTLLHIKAFCTVELLYLGRERIRLERRLFRRCKAVEFLTSNITNVLRDEVSGGDDELDHPIRIVSPNQTIGFGSTLSEAEQNWLRWEILHYIGRDAGQNDLSPDKA
jgi:hypothetical protein